MTINDRYQEWRSSLYQKAIDRFPERKPEFKTSFDTTIEPVYLPKETNETYLETQGMPGLYPFVRGVQPTMYRGRFWTMRQYAGFGTAEESNKRYKYLLGQGQTGLSVAFDLPTQIGYDSDDALADGEVGKVGVAIDSLHDMEVLFEGIPLDKVSTSMTINSTASVLLAFYIAVAEKQGVGMTQILGTIQNDILKEYIARGTYRFPPKPSMRLITDIFEFCSQKVPKWNTISISGYHIREAGSNAVQEIAFTIADGIAYVDAALKAGMEVDVFAPRLSFFFNSHNDLLEEIAKFRAARRLWAEIMKERFGAKKAKSMQMRFHTQTAGSTLTAQQPWNNIVRVGIQTLAATLGGTQSLHTNSYDEALALPTEESVRIALRTQQIVAHESGIANTIDPLAGSYFIEELTEQMYAKAKTYIAKIDDLGGMVEAVEKGFVQKEVQDSAYYYQKEIERGERVVVGVNKFQVEEAPPSGLLKVDPSIQQRQIDKINSVKADRNDELVAQNLKKITEIARGEENMMPFIIEAAKNYATLGEIIYAMQEVFGEHKETVIL